MGDPARANMLTALMAGKALTSSELAQEAGVTAATASAHLAKLHEAGLVKCHRQGRHRYWSLGGDEVAQVLESLLGLAARAGHVRVRTGPKEPALRKARVCYDHLAGDYGVRLFDSLVEKEVLIQSDDGISLGAGVARFIEEMGLELRPSSRRPVCRACLDWSVRRPHLAGQLGAAVLERLFELGWAKREPDSRIVRFTADGERRFLKLTRLERVAAE
ncbi:MAG TPA: helix-turn-helix domain-containing protein [Asticcacaulis sp.]|nr:helix-turn-helix domain-containing protein [Asticcacaulis sp.]